jgi:hypothetical protein
VSETLDSDPLVAPETAGGIGLFLGGAPVTGSRGVDAAFAASARAGFERLVTAAWRNRQHGPLKKGPPRDPDDERLHVTDLVRSAFGAPLAAPLLAAVRESMLAVAAAAEGDDALADAAEQLDARALSALHELFVVLKKGRATLRVVSDELDRQLDVAMVALAAERTEAVFDERHDVPVEGVLVGVAPESRTFELQGPDGQLLRGRISSEIEDANLRAINPTWASQACVARLRIVTITRAGRSRTRYTLRRIEPLRP